MREELITTTPPTWAHILIAGFLERKFKAQIEQLGYDWIALRETEQCTNEESSRLPNVTVVPFDQMKSIRYQVKRFRENNQIVPHTFEGLNLTANQIFASGSQRGKKGTIGSGDR